MKAAKAFSIVLVLGLLGYGAFVFLNPASRPSALDGLVKAMPAARKVELVAGKKLDLVLLTALESGGSKVGEAVDLVVATDVLTEKGEVIVAKGSIARGEVTKSRAGSTVGTLTNNPARLEITLKDVKAADGQWVPISYTIAEDVKVERRPVYEFSFANTSAEFVESGVKDLWSDPEAQQTLKEVATGLTRGELPEGDAWNRIAGRLGLEDTKSAIDGTQKADLKKAVDGLHSGDISGLSGIDLLVAAKAIGEIENLATGVDRQIRGMLKGRNIEAHIGTPVKAVVAEKRTVTVRPPSANKG
ncbi:MAG: hypothetical protein KF812_13335 [Fimbriimonadaceae bacterium]|nr:hypothetical protein [Fimbriimonadaceae bacterium]